ncbi:unnamed protein product [Prunus armeniaca]
MVFNNLVIGGSERWRDNLYWGYFGRNRAVYHICQQIEFTTYKINITASLSSPYVLTVFGSSPYFDSMHEVVYTAPFDSTLLDWFKDLNRLVTNKYGLLSMVNLSIGSP